MLNLVDIWTACATWEGWVGRIVIGKFLKKNELNFYFCSNNQIRNYILILYLLFIIVSYDFVLYRLNTS